MGEAKRRKQLASGQITLEDVQIVPAVPEAQEIDWPVFWLEIYEGEHLLYEVPLQIAPEHDKGRLWSKAAAVGLQVIGFFLNPDRKEFIAALKEALSNSSYLQLRSLPLPEKYWTLMRDSDGELFMGDDGLPWTMANREDAPPPQYRRGIQQINSTEVLPDALGDWETVDHAIYQGAIHKVANTLLSQMPKDMYSSTVKLSGK